MHSWSTPAPPALPAQQDQLRLYDTAAEKILPVEVTDSQASLYVCGITPYDATHLGHANTYVFFDVLNRYWRASGHQVYYTQNITDVDDPLFERANETGVAWDELAEDQTHLFRSDMQILNVLPPDHYLAVSETVDWVVETVEALVKNGTAYQVSGSSSEPDGDIYFDIAAAEKLTDWKLGSIAAMSRKEMSHIFPERGGDPDRPGKRDPLDPLLWKAARENEPSWTGGSLGRGRPGWHIECSAIARRTLPSPFTVQAGGSDLRFPHHEFSAAHAIAQDHKPMAQHFVHSGMVGLDGTKMSKSLGNLVLVSKLHEEGYKGVEIRALLLNNHFSSDWDFSRGDLDATVSRVARWKEALSKQSDTDGEQLLTALHLRLSDNLDTPSALKIIDDWAAQVSATTANKTSPKTTPTLRVEDVLDGLLGLKL